MTQAHAHRQDLYNFNFYMTGAIGDMAVQLDNLICPYMII